MPQPPELSSHEQLHITRVSSSPLHITRASSSPPIHIVGWTHGGGLLDKLWNKVTKGLNDIARMTFVFGAHRNLMLWACAWQKSLCFTGRALGTMRRDCEHTFRAGKSEITSP
jgi:hypothetical protein